MFIPSCKKKKTQNIRKKNKLKFNKAINSTEHGNHIYCVNIISDTCFNSTNNNISLEQKILFSNPVTVSDAEKQRVKLGLIGW